MNWDLIEYMKIYTNSYIKNKYDIDYFFVYNDIDHSKYKDKLYFDNSLDIYPYWIEPFSMNILKKIKLIRKNNFSYTIFEKDILINANNLDIYSKDNMYLYNLNMYFDLNNSECVLMEDFLDYLNNYKDINKLKILFNDFNNITYSEEKSKNNEIIVSEIEKKMKLLNSLNR